MIPVPTSQLVGHLAGMVRDDINQDQQQKLKYAIPNVDMAPTTQAEYLTAEELALFETNIDMNTNGDEWTAVAAASLIKDNEQQ